MTRAEVNFTSSQSYAGSMESLRTCIEGNRSGSVIAIRAIIRHGHFELLMDPCNLWILGFRNANGNEYRFRDCGAEGIGTLPITSKHGHGGLAIWDEKFTWGEVDNLVTLVNYNQYHVNVRKALAFAVVAIAEASRFEELLIAFTKMFAGDVPFIDPRQNPWKDLINNWEVYSRESAEMREGIIRIQHIG